MPDHDPERAGNEEEEEDEDGQPKAKAGMSQSSKDDLGVCIIVLSITLLAVIVTVIKIILLDVAQYPELFGRATTPQTPVDVSTTTRGPFL